MNQKLFVDTYVWNKNPRHSYLILAPGSMDFKLEYLNPSQRDGLKFKKACIDGIEHYTLSISLKFAKTLGTTDYPNTFCYCLLQKLSEEGLKVLYPRIWIDYHNYRIRKQNAREFQQFCQLRKLGKLPKKPDAYIRHLTQNVSIREASKWSIS